MTKKALATTNQFDIMPADAGKDTAHRVGQFQTWQQRRGDNPLSPSLADYRDHLLHERGLATSSTRAHLSTIRGAYRAILTDNSTRDSLYQLAAEQFDTVTERKAFVDEALKRLENAIEPSRSGVTVTKKQDQLDSENVRLSSAQASALLAAPGVADLTALRDTAVIAVLLCTGLREAEVCALNVCDLRQTVNGELCVYVRQGKGAKARAVPWGELDFALAIVDKWLDAAAIDTSDKEAAVFWSFWRGGKKRRGRLTVRALQNILKRYPVMVGGELVTVKPHDLRRTYARRLYEAGVDLVSIQQNLGHASTETTLGYIGQLDMDKRAAPAVYSFDLSALRSVSTPQPLPGRAHDGFGGASEVARNAHNALNEFLDELR